MALETKTPPQPIYRVGRQPDAWRPPDWSRASADGTFGNRFDDPESYYRVLYASKAPGHMRNPYVISALMPQIGYAL